MGRQIGGQGEPDERPYVVTARRAILALPVGAFVGGLLLSLFIYVFRFDLAPAQFASMQTMFILSVATSTAFFAVGLVFLGVPLWMLLDKMRLRSAPIMAAAGALLLLLVLRPPLNHAAPLAVIGAAVGLTIWLIAYRKEPKA